MRNFSKGYLRYLPSGDFSRYLKSQLSSRPLSTSRSISGKWSSFEEEAEQFGRSKAKGKKIEKKGHKIQLILGNLENNVAFRKFQGNQGFLRIVGNLENFRVGKTCASELSVHDQFQIHSEFSNYYTALV